MCHKCGSRLIHATTLYVKMQNVPIRIALWSYHTGRQRHNELSPLTKWVDDCKNLIYIQANEINSHSQYLIFSQCSSSQILCTLDIHSAINLLRQSVFASHILTMHDNVTPIHTIKKPSFKECLLASMRTTYGSSRIPVSSNPISTADITIWISSQRAWL